MDEPGRAFFRFADEDHTTGFGGGLELSARFLPTRSIVIVPDARSKGWPEIGNVSLSELILVGGGSACQSSVLFRKTDKAAIGMRRPAR